MADPIAPSNPRRTAYSYIRFSTPEQAAGDSLRRQTALRDEMVKRHGWELDTTLTLLDPGIPSYRMQNMQEGSALRRFFDAVECGIVKPGSVLIIEALDRFSRADPMDSMPEILDLFKKDILIAVLRPSERVYAKHPDSMKNMATAIEILVALSTANLESENKSKLSIANWAEKRARAAGRKMSRVCPAWLEPVLDDDGAVIKFDAVEWKRDIVVRIFTMAADGFGVPAIVRRLRDEGVETITTGKRAAPWSVGYVNRILTSRSVLGEHQPRVMVKGRAVVVPGVPAVPDYYPAAVSEELFARARAGMAERNQRRGRSTPRVSNLFTGLVCEAATGSPMCFYSYVQGRRFCYLTPRSYYQGESRVGRLVPYDLFERKVLETLAAELGTTGPTTAGKEAVTAELSKSRGSLDRLRVRIDACKKRLIDADDDEMAEVTRMELAGLLLERKDAEKRVQKLLAQSTADPAGVRLLLDALAKPGPGQDREQLRRRVRARLPELVEAIAIHSTPHPTYRRCAARVYYVKVWLRGVAKPARLFFHKDPPVPKVNPVFAEWDRIKKPKPVETRRPEEPAGAQGG